MKKRELRKKYKNLRLCLEEEEIGRLSLDIANNLLQLPIWNFDFYHLFLTISEQKEVDTEAVLHILLGKDKNVVISKTNMESLHLTNYLLTDNTMIRKNRWNIPEPVDGIEISAQQIDVVFVPLLAFDESGQRIGYGKGVYDNFLANCRSDIIKVGLSFYDAEAKISESFKSDIHLYYYVTQTKTYPFEK